MRNAPPTSGPHTSGTKALRAAIEASGYYPDVVAEAVFEALAGEDCLAHLVQHEATIDEHDEVRRHATVLALTGSRLLLAHTDEHAPDEQYSTPYTSTSTETVALSALRTVVLNRVVAPEQSRRKHAGLPHEAVLTLGWGGMSRVDLEPAACGDPACDADHGYSGVVGTDDFSLRVSAAVEGVEAVRNLIAFAGVLSGLTATFAR